MRITKDDAVRLCVALGWSNATKWTDERLKRRLSEMAEILEGADSYIEEGDVPDDEERNYLNGLIAQLVADSGEVEFVESYDEAPAEQEEVEEVSAQAEVGTEVEDEVEEQEVEEQQEQEAEEQEAEEPEEEVAEEKPKAKAKAKNKAKRGRRAKSDKQPTCHSVSMDLLCKNPDMEWKELKETLQKMGLFRDTSARTAFNFVRAIVRRLRQNGLMK